MKTNNLAFCLYGDFIWSLAPDSFDPLAKKVPGVLAIRFVQHPLAANQYAAWLGWKPASYFGRDATTEDLPAWDKNKEYKYLSSQKTPWKIFKPEEECGVWLQPGLDRRHKGLLAHFRGAYLLDAFSLKDNAQQRPIPRLRWPLVQQFNHRRKKGLHSGLVLGTHFGPLFGEKRDTFTFDLGFPIPLVNKCRGAYKARRSLPFRASFATNDPAPDALDECVSLALGAQDGPRRRLTIPENASLGCFGLTPYGGKLSFASTKNIPRNPKNAQTTLARWWPISPVGDPVEHFRRLGFSTDAENKYRFLRAAVNYELGTPDNFGLDLRDAETSSHSISRHIVRYRFRQAAYNPLFDRKVDEKKSDISHRKGEIRLRFEDEIGGWLHLGQNKHVIFDFEMSWPRGDAKVGEIFRDKEEMRAELLTPRLSCRILWDEPAPVLPGSPKEQVSSREQDAPRSPNQQAVHAFGCLLDAVQSMTSGRHAIDRVEGSQHTSLFPHLSTAPDQPDQSVWFETHAPELRAWWNEHGELEWERDTQTDSEKNGWRLSLESETSAKRLMPEAQRPPWAVEAEFPSFEVGVAHKRNYPICIAYDERVLKGEDGFAFYRLENPKDPASPRWLSGRLSSLSFEGADTLLSDEKDGSNEDNSTELPESTDAQANETSSSLTLSRLNVFTKNLFKGGHPDELVGVRLRLNLAMRSAGPSGIDAHRDDHEQRALPLLIEQGHGGVSNKIKQRFVLFVEESLLTDEDRSFRARVMLRRREASDPRAYIMLAQEPFGLVRFAAEPLENRGDDQRSTVAVYSGTTRMWEFRQVSDTYRYTFPAQSIGEGTDKPRRHEIYDLAEKANEITAPYIGTRGALIVDQRLTPSSELWIRPSDLARGYFLPEWGLYEIFRQRGDFGLGVALVAFRGEFLYGLSVGVDAARESGDGASARVAEIEALTGRIIEQYALPGKNDVAMRGRWESVRNALRQRPQRLEIWVERPKRARPFVPARFESGVEFALRETALHRSPVEPPEREGENESELALLPPVRTPERSPRYHPSGLPGGALWPMESWNLFEGLRNDPESDGGSLEGVALSPLGGDADQSASFRNGNVKIISQTRSGRVQRQRVEVMGRIAALWCRAKHVIVYERTVNATAQFASGNERPGSDLGPTRTRRPVLRKVTEYVELLEPVRSYPDVDAVSARTSAFLDSVRFNTKRIHVDSAWSSEVGSRGWKIPLWNRYSARIHPQVYLRPDISFVTGGEGQGDRPRVAQECLNPENIYFYAESTREANTDLWAPVLGVDYSDTLDPVMMLAALEPQETQKVNPQARRANVPRTLPGYKRFTWRLMPAAQKTRLNAERGDKPIFAGLESITFMRALPNEDGSKIVKGILENRDAALKLLPNVEELPQYWGGDGSGHPTEGPAKVVDLALESLRAAIAINDKTKGQEAFNEINTELSSDFIGHLFTSDTRIRNGLASAKEVYKKLGDKVDGFDRLVSGVGSRCSDLADEAAGGIQRKKRLIAENTREAVADIKEAIKKLPATRGKAVDEIAKKIIKRVSPGLDRVRADVGNIGASIETARAIAADAAEDVVTAVARGRARIDERLAAFDSSKPWSDNRLAEFNNRLRLEVEGIYLDAIAATEEAGQRLALELDDAVQLIGPLAAAAIAKVVQVRTQVVRGLEEGSFSVEQIASSSIHALDRLYDPQTGTGVTVRLQVQLNRLEAKLKKIEDEDRRKKVKDAIEAVRETLNKTPGAVGTVREEVTNAAERSQDTLASIRQAVTNAAEKVTEEFIGQVDSLKEKIEVVTRLLETGVFDEIAKELYKSSVLVTESIKRLKSFKQNANETLEDIERVVASTRETLASRLDDAENETRAIAQDVFAQLDDALATISTWARELQRTLWADRIEDSPVVRTLREAIVEPAVRRVLDPFPDSVFKLLGDTSGGTEARRAVANALDDLADEVESGLNQMTGELLRGVDEISDACGLLSRSVEDLKKWLGNEEQKFKEHLKKQLRHIIKGTTYENIEKFVKDWNPKELEKIFNEFEGNIRSVVNEAGSIANHARVYADRLIEEAGNLGEGGLSAAPSNVLRLLSAASSSPELAMLKGNIDRLRTAYREAEEFISSNRVKALLAQLGDALKAIGLAIPFDKLSSEILPDTSNLKLNDLLKNICGIDINGLFDGVKLPENVSDAVKLTHDLDAKRGTAWVQADVNIALPGRKKLFQIGPFTALFKNAALSSQIRLEATKDSGGVSETGVAQIGTTIELEVAGQLIVSLEKCVLSYTEENGLDFDFDPRYIRLNSVFQFIQDTLGSIIPDELGGLTIIKQNGVPVGVEHIFTMPPINANFGTSGVTNLSVGNRFGLLAYPDFVLSDRFNLSRRNQPFIFSIFIIGGTGYVQAEAEYRPFDKALSVYVEAAAGGSAALAFSIGPVAGGVAITLSVALGYRKRIGSPGGGLSVSLVLVVGGNVTLWGMVNIYLTIALSMTYRPSGAIDAEGDLQVEVRVSRWFKLKYRTTVTYRLRGGQSSRQTLSSSSLEPGPELDRLTNKAKQLQKARERVSK